jgi:alpha-galactosidase
VVSSPQLELAGTLAGPGLAVEVDELENGVLAWRVANRGDEPVTVDRVGLRYALRRDRRRPLRMYQHGWQSWSPTGGAVLGQTVDPSCVGEPHPLARATYHADDAPTPVSELRSELVTVLADGDDAVCLGFDGGARHDGTLRVRDDEVVVEAFLGGAVMAPGEVRELHAVRIEAGAPSELLSRWARWAGGCSGARVSAPYQVGWCSWYQYFDGVTEDIVRVNAAAAADWPFDVFQVDDGYQAAIGDWTRTADSFPSPLEDLATAITAAGMVPGLWLAPFLVAPASEVARTHPEWLVRRPSGRPAVGIVHPVWGGAMHVLDTTRPDVLAHLEAVARDLRAMGWSYLKLDFTYAPSFTAQWSDPAATPAQRVRAGYDAIRRGAGDDAFVLGCGAPLGPCIGVVDGMRIGPDVAPAWAPADENAPYASAAPSTRNAWRNTLARAPLHRALWLNDPDCLMLRASDTDLAPGQVDAWALAVAMSGGMAIVSDDLTALGADARRRLDDVIAIGLEVDDAARSGAPPACPDLLDAAIPTTLEAAGRRLVGEPLSGAAVLHRLP